MTTLILLSCRIWAALKPGDFVTSGSPTAPRIALTFDDGPGPNTHKFLTLLDKYNVKATFFVLGDQVKLRPKVAKSIVEHGHEIGSHTMQHTNYKARLKKIKEESPDNATELTQAELVADMMKSREVIESAIGEKLTYLRMPHGIDGPWVHAAAREAGFVLVNWTYGSDWTSPPPDPTDILKKSYLKALRPGCIYLIHDGWPKSDKSLAVTEAIIKAAKEKNFTIVPVGELLQPSQKTK